MCLAPASHNHRVEFEPAVDCENLLAVLEAEQPFPLAVIDKQPPQVARAEITVKTGRNNDAETSVVLKQCMSLFKKQFVEVQISRALMAE